MTVIGTTAAPQLSGTGANLKDKKVFTICIYFLDFNLDLAPNDSYYFPLESSERLRWGLYIAIYTF